MFVCFKQWLQNFVTEEQRAEVKVESVSSHISNIQSAVLVRRM